MDLTKGCSQAWHSLICKKHLTLLIIFSLGNWNAWTLMKQIYHGTNHINKINFFWVNIENEYSNPDELACSVPQGSIFDPLIFPLYANDMSQSMNSVLLFYADDSYLIFTGLHLNKNTVWLVCGKQI